MRSPAVYDHVRPTTSDYPDGIYRVVGTNGETVTMLRVGDDDGQRVSTGELITVTEDDLDAFDWAANPDGNRPLGTKLKLQVEMVYWSLRVFVQQLLAHPVPAAIGIATVLVGRFGGQFISLPAAVFGGLIFAGSLWLAYVGSGRL